MMATDLLPGNENGTQRISSPMHGYSNKYGLSAIRSGKSSIPSIRSQSPLSTTKEFSGAGIQRRLVSSYTNATHE